MLYLLKLVRYKGIFFIGMADHREAKKWKPLTIITKSSILDVEAVLDPPLEVVLHICNFHDFIQYPLMISPATANLNINFN